MPYPDVMSGTPYGYSWIQCPPGSSHKTFAASQSRMCVLPHKDASEGVVWHAIGSQVTYSQADKCYVVDCPSQLNQAAAFASVAVTSPEKALAMQQSASGSSTGQGDQMSGPVIITIRRATWGAANEGSGSDKQGSSSNQGSGRKLAGASADAGVPVGVLSQPVIALAGALQPRILQQQDKAPRVFEIKQTVAACFVTCEVN